MLFVASLSCFDQALYEENDVNAMREALSLFEEVVNARYFKRVSMICFLNKADLFEIKIGQVDIGDHFKEYTGEPHSYELGVAFFRDMF